MPKEIAITFGKFNPPSLAHHALVAGEGGLIDYANKLGLDHIVYTSNRYLKKLKKPKPHKETPLSPEQKKKHLSRFFGTSNIQFRESPHQAIEELLEQGYDKIHIMVGSDRMETLAPNLRELYGDRVHVVKYGDERKAGAEGIAGVSSTELRNFAAKNDYEGFKRMQPGHLSEIGRAHV